MTISSSTLGLVYGSSWGTAGVSAAQATMDGALMASVTYGQSGLAAGSLESQLLNLSFTDGSGTSMFDVLGAYYGAPG